MGNSTIWAFANKNELSAVKEKETKRNGKNLINIASSSELEFNFSSVTTFLAKIKKLFESVL